MITFTEVVKKKPKSIIYSINTMWWTHDEKDCIKKTLGSSVDVFGSPLYETIDVPLFLNRVEIENKPEFGAPANRVNNFMLFHAQNIGDLVNTLIKEEFPPSWFKKIVGSAEEICRWLDKNYNVPELG